MKNFVANIGVVVVVTIFGNLGAGHAFPLDKVATPSLGDVQKWFTQGGNNTSCRGLLYYGVPTKTLYNQEVLKIFEDNLPISVVISESENESKLELLNVTSKNWLPLRQRNHIICSRSKLFTP